MESEFYQLGFEKHLYVKDRLSIDDCFTKNNRCGIYILHFENGEYYVGLAIDIPKRFAQHRKNHSDIEFISFKEVLKAKLASAEKETVYQLELLKKPLRNISIVSIITGDTDFDEIVSKELQEKWTNYELNKDSLQTPRFDYPDLRKKYTPKFKKLQTSTYYLQICEILQNYVLYTIPFPAKTEYFFWACSCLPTYRKVPLFSRVNIYWQETLNIYENKYLTEDGKTIKCLAVSIYLCKSKLFEKTTKKKLEKEYSTIQFFNNIYETGGQDQQNIVMHADEFLDFLYDPLVTDAIKEFNLRLMRKGACNNNRYHCFDLADEILRTDNIDFE